MPSAAVAGPPNEKVKFRVCIDPGHPSERNDGLTEVNGLTEAGINWQIGSRLRDALSAAGFEVIMTKNSEAEFKANKARAEIANEHSVNLMLRLHADAGKSTGFTIYYPRRQGHAEGVTGPAPEVLAASAAAARLFHGAFADELGGALRDNGLHGDEETFVGSKQGALTGSIFSRVPVVLVEMVFLTNRADAEWIRKGDNQRRMVAALVAGVRAVAGRGKN